MSDGESPDRSLLQQLDQRLTHLINTVYPDESRRPGFSRLAHEIHEKTGRKISSTYLWELVTGRKRNVTVEQLEVLAEFFGVPPSYFFDEEAAAKVNRQMKLAVALGNARIRNLAMRAEGLSEESLDAILSIVSAARGLQNLPPASHEGDDPLNPRP